MAAGNQRGFTLIEVLVCVAIISTALALLYRPLIAGADTWRYIEEREEAQRLLEQQIFEFREKLAGASGMISPAETRTVLGRDKAFEYRRVAKGLPQGGPLYEIECQMSWMRAGILKRINRSFYAYVPRPAAQ